LNDEFLTEAEACRTLKVGKTTLIKLSKLPGFPIVRLPGVRRVLIPKQALRDWISQQAGGGSC